MYVFKGFDKNLQCRGFQYEIGKTYTMDEDPIICVRGFHFCKELGAVFYYYPVFWVDRYCIVEVPDDAWCLTDGKGVTNNIRIVKEITEDVRIGLAARTFAHTIDDPLIADVAKCKWLVGGKMSSDFDDYLLNKYIVPHLDAWRLFCDIAELKENKNE